METGTENKLVITKIRTYEDGVIKTLSMMRYVTAEAVEDRPGFEAKFIDDYIGDEDGETENNEASPVRPCRSGVWEHRHRGTREDERVKNLKHKEVSCSGRRYTRWTKVEECEVKQYFDSYIKNTGPKKLPGRKEILSFLAKATYTKHNWSTVRTKVMNEKAKREKKQMRMSEMDSS